MQQHARPIWLCFYARGGTVAGPAEEALHNWPPWYSRRILIYRGAARRLRALCCVLCWFYIIIVKVGSLLKAAPVFAGPPRARKEGVVAWPLNSRHRRLLSSRRTQLGPPQPQPPLSLLWSASGRPC